MVCLKVPSRVLSVHDYALCSSLGPPIDTAWTGSASELRHLELERNKFDGGLHRLQS